MAMMPLTSQKRPKARSSTPSSKKSEKIKHNTNNFPVFAAADVAAGRGFRNPRFVGLLLSKTTLLCQRRAQRISEFPNQNQKKTNQTIYGNEHHTSRNSCPGEAYRRRRTEVRWRHLPP